mmetsp:Transcript_7778/g.18953  ORF Transcript_7778/g.18953 Transcript_7778/m.18953 type:complete len:333 (+) Transcript_7778:3376-4374(+)
MRGARNPGGTPALPPDPSHGPATARLPSWIQLASGPSPAPLSHETAATAPPLSPPGAPQIRNGATSDSDRRRPAVGASRLKLVPELSPRPSLSTSRRPVLARTQTQRRQWYPWGRESAAREIDAPHPPPLCELGPFWHLSQWSAKMKMRGPGSLRMTTSTRWRWRCPSAGWSETARHAWLPLPVQRRSGARDQDPLLPQQSSRWLPAAPSAYCHTPRSWCGTQGLRFSQLTALYEGWRTPPEPRPAARPARKLGAYQRPTHAAPAVGDRAAPETSAPRPSSPTPATSGQPQRWPPRVAWPGWWPPVPAVAPYVVRRPAAKAPPPLSRSPAQR